MIKISYIWDKELALNSSLDIYEYELKNSNKKFIGWFFIALAQFGVVGALKHNAYGFLIIATLGLIYWYGLRWPLRKYFIMKTFSKSSLSGQTISLAALEDGVYKDNQLQFLYKDVEEVIKLDNAILIYYKSQTIYFPDKAFLSKEQRQKFISFIPKI